MFFTRGKCPQIPRRSAFFLLFFPGSPMKRISIISFLIEHIRRKSNAGHVLFHCNDHLTIPGCPWCFQIVQSFLWISPPPPPLPPAAVVLRRVQHGVHGGAGRLREHLRPAAGAFWEFLRPVPKRHAAQPGRPVPLLRLLQQLRPAGPEKVLRGGNATCAVGFFFFFFLLDLLNLNAKYIFCK